MEIRSYKLMKKYFILLFTILFLTSCDQKYIVKNNSVYLKGWNEGIGNYERLISDADAKSFENIELEDFNGEFGKDNYKVFYDGKAIINCDPKTFEFLGNYLFKDKNALYFFGFYSDSNDWRIDIVDPKKIKLFTYPWSTDGEHLLYGYKPIKLDDANDFQAIDEKWGKTKTKIIYEDQILEKADYNTFEVINYSTAKDKNHTYEYGKAKD